jgi:hypothetical protein
LTGPLKGSRHSTPQIADKSDVYPELAYGQSLSCDNHADLAALSEHCVGKLTVAVIIG